MAFTKLKPNPSLEMEDKLSIRLMDPKITKKHMDPKTFQKLPT
jgi:hypothetical protein